MDLAFHITLNYTAAILSNSLLFLMIIKHSHPFLCTSQDVIELAKPLQKLGISYFTYTKSEKNGERTYLSTHPQILENYISKEYFLVGNVESDPKKYKNQVVFWDTLPKQHVYDENVRAYGVDHGIFMIKPYEDYCEFYGFATTKGNDKIINTYLTHMDVLIQFTQFFKERAKELIQQGESQKILLPFHNDSLDFVDKESRFVFNDVFAMENRLLEVNLSPRQLQCANYLLQGNTMKEIAKKLALSPRTIEAYLNGLKIKLKCRTKVELIIRLTEYKSRLGHFDPTLR